MNRNANRRKKINRLAMLYAVFLEVVVFALIWWWQSPPTKARQLGPLLEEIDGFKATTGQYPTAYLSFATYSNLTSRFAVYAGGRDTNGVIWDPHEVSGRDFTVLLARDGYEVFLPVGRVKMISFSSFPVWRYDSNNRRWRKGRIHRSFSGTFGQKTDVL